MQSPCLPQLGLGHVWAASSAATLSPTANAGTTSEHLCHGNSWAPVLVGRITMVSIAMFYLSFRKHQGSITKCKWFGLVFIKYLYAIGIYKTCHCFSFGFIFLMNSCLTTKLFTNRPVVSKNVSVVAISLELIA